MTATRLEYLFDCYLKDNCTVQEEKELMLLLAEPENQGAFQLLIDHVIESTGSEIPMSDQVSGTIIQNVIHKGSTIVVPIKKRKTSIVFWMNVAAVTILFLAGAAFWVFDKNNNSTHKVSLAGQIISPVLSEENRAVLKTSDGNTFIPDLMQNGIIVQNGAIKISRHGGVLVFTASPSANPSGAIVYNTLSTPRGGQYQVVMSDGSKVWLNAASSLRFPATFSEGKREVELTGEAYFEVTKNLEKPFFVKIGAVQVQVLGTHFNVNAYPNEEEIKTSLLEGSVKITKGKAIGMLKPGEQAVLNNKKDEVKITNTNMDKVMAWKNGLFQFDGTDINNIMREISRWYKVEIVYTEKVNMRQFEGKISRNAKLSEVLRILELSGVKFTLIGNKIIMH